MADKHAILKQTFGYASFREGQAELIDRVMAGQDVLGVMPTGAGKSLCFQIPALLHSGITVVVSPLISLMKDQVNALTQSGIRAAYLNSSLNAAQYAQTLQNAAAGEYRILYVAPERLLAPDFLAYALAAPIAMVTVDEAHCVSQWGQDFRPSYLKIAEFIARLPRRPVVSAFTATATPLVRDDIARLLRLQNEYVLITGFNRENLYFDVRKPKDKTRELLYLMNQYAGKSGIVYCSTRKNVEAVCDALNEKGFSATRYHAGLGDAERHTNQDDFVYDKRSVMVATNAFGMGIDKSNISFVVHYNMPKNLESYYQEAGRAGRDGSPADCIMLYSPQDVRTNQFLINHSREASEELDEEAIRSIREKNLELLKQITFYCTTTECLRSFFLRYFGENAPVYCGHCSNCNTHYETTDVTVEAQKIISCVYRVQRQGRHFGKGMIANILHGSKNERIRRLGLDGLPTYGIMADAPVHRIVAIIDFLVEKGWLSLSQDEYPVLLANGRSAYLIKTGEAVEMKLPRPQASQRKTAATADVEEPALFEKLKELRSRLAKTAGVPAYVIFTDAALRDMCRRLPTGEEEFLEVSGVGQAKLQRYGEEFIALIRDYAAEKQQGA